MNLKDMFKKTNARAHYISLRHSHPEVPTGLLRKCNKCGAAIIAEDVKNGYYICPKCHGYFRVHAYRRIEMIADEGTFEEWDKEMDFANPLDFKGYEEKIESLKERTHLNEAIVTGRVEIGGHPAVVGVCDGRFMMASMGRIVGEKIARAVERATEEKLPVILFTCSGGARMQEGIVSLMQMAKTSAALKKHSDAGLLYVTVLTDPTTGGVTASFAMLGDIILAEPKASRPQHGGGGGKDAQEHHQGKDQAQLGIDLFRQEHGGDASGIHVLQGGQDGQAHHGGAGGKE